MKNSVFNIKKSLSMNLTAIVCCVVAALAAPAADAQTALSTNIAEWATTTANAGIEHGFGKKYSVMVDGIINPWNFSRQRHFHLWMARGELRQWLCEPMNGHFFGVHLLGGQYNIKNIDLPFGMLPKTLDGRHYEGWYVGAGVTYGYQWILSRHWNAEAALGIGYAYSPYKLYGRCAKVLENDHRDYVGPTKISLSIAYVF